MGHILVYTQITKWFNYYTWLNEIYNIIIILLKRLIIVWQKVNKWTIYEMFKFTCQICKE